MSDTTDGGTGRDERTLREEAIAARLADLVVAVGLANQAAALAVSTATAAARVGAALGAYCGLAGIPEPSQEEIERARERLVASLGGSPERNGAAPPKPRIVTDG